MPFVQMENISHFLRACELSPLNLPSHDRFLTVDLYDSKDPAQVLQCIAAFSRAANAINPSAFPTTLGAKSKGSSMSPQGTGSSGPRSPAYTTTTTTRPRGTSNTAGTESPSLAFNSVNRATYSGRISPSKSSLGRGGLATGETVSSWSNRNDEGKTVPAWNIHQYGYMGGASQGNQGVAFGARRQITSPSPNVPSLAEKEKRLKEDAERKRVEAEEHERLRRAQEAAVEEEARLGEGRRWAEETRRQREQEAEEAREAERQRLQEEELVRQEEQRRQQRAYQRDREREAAEQAEQESQLARERGRQRTENDTRLNGQFLSQYQAEEQARSHIASPPAKPLVEQQTTEIRRIAELERQLEEMKAQQRQHSRPVPEPEMQAEPPAPPLPDWPQAGQVSNDGDWNETERAFLKQAWQTSQSLDTRAPPKPPRPNVISTTGSSRPLPDPAAYAPGANRTDRYLASHPPPSQPRPASHRPQDYSTTTEVDLEQERRNQSQARTNAGGWASKSLLEREMERERERQREWEEEQRVTSARARDANEGSRPGQSWDVHQYGYMGGDSQNRGGHGLGVGGARRQIIGPRPPP